MVTLSSMTIVKMYCARARGFSSSQSGGVGVVSRRATAEVEDSGVAVVRRAKKKVRRMLNVFILALEGGC